MIYPSSTEDKFIFVSNMDGAGFQRETYLTCPPTVPLDNMINAVNVACYKQWEVTRNLNEKNPFGRLDLLTNWSLGLLLVLWLGLYVLYHQSSDFVSYYLYTFLVFSTFTLLYSYGIDGGIAGGLLPEGLILRC